MIPSNINDEMRGILERKGKGGWLRVSEAEEAYVELTPVDENKGTRRTTYYRWRKTVEKGRAKGFQYVPLPKNRAYIGLDSADPRIVESAISEDKNIRRSIKDALGFFDWLEHRAERKRLEKEKKLFNLELEICVLEHMMYTNEGDRTPETKLKLYKKCRSLLKDKYPSVVHES